MRAYIIGSDNDLTELLIWLNNCKADIVLSRNRKAAQYLIKNVSSFHCIELKEFAEEISRLIAQSDTDSIVVINEDFIPNTDTSKLITTLRCVTSS